MAFSTYATGTVAIANGGTIITGVGSIWSGVNARAGDDIVINGNTVVVLDVTDTTHLVIDPWPYTTVAAGASYKIIQRSPLRYAGGQAMADVSTLVAALNTDGFFVFVSSSLTVPDPSLGNDGQYARQPSTSKEWLKTGGTWVYQGIYGNLNFDSTPWSSITTYALRTVVNRSGKLYMSLQSTNLNHVPESSPTYWQLFLSGGDTYEVVMFDTDRPASGEEVLKMRFTQTVTFYAGLTASRADADVGATTTAVYSYKKNGTQFGTLTFASGGQAGSQSGTFTSATDTVFSAGDILTIFAPASRDATLSGIGATLTGYR